MSGIHYMHGAKPLQRHEMVWHRADDRFAPMLQVSGHIAVIRYPIGYLVASRGRDGWHPEPAKGGRGLTEYAAIRQALRYAKDDPAQTISPFLREEISRWHDRIDVREGIERDQQAELRREVRAREERERRAASSRRRKELLVKSIRGAKLPKMAKGSMVSFAFREGREPKPGERDAIFTPSGFWSVTKSPDEFEPYIVHHVPGGKRVWQFKRLQDAKKYAAFLESFRSVPGIRSSSFDPPEAVRSEWIRAGKALSDPRWKNVK